MVITNCVVTQIDSEVLKDYNVYAEDPAYKRIHQYCPGVDLSAYAGFTAYPGMVVYKGTDDFGKVVIIQTGTNFCVSYSHLSNILVELGSVLDSVYTVGQCDTYLHLELLTKVESKWPIRIGSEVWYKDDPYKLLNGAMEPYYHRGYSETVRQVEEDDEPVNMNSDTAYIMINGYEDTVLDYV